MSCFRMRVAFLLFNTLCGWCAFGQGSIELSSFPQIAVADGSSEVTISAVVRDGGGSKVADGSMIRFSSSMGTFREADVLVANGVARAVLVAPDTPGVARVTASAPGIGIVSVLDIEFVSDRAALTSSRQYVSISDAEYLVYHTDQQIVSAFDSHSKAQVQYRDIEIRAKDLQLNVQRMQVVAVDAILKIEGKTIECRRLKYNLLLRKGTAIANIDGSLVYCNLTAAEALKNETGMQPREFEFADVGMSATSIHASRIMAYPNREIQFHRARVYVGDTHVMSMQYHSLKPTPEAYPLGEMSITYVNNSVVLNYPYYLSLSPEKSSVLRLRSGTSFSRGYGASGGIFLDWENNYNGGGVYDGSVTLGGIGRKDMGLSWKHYHQFDERTTANVLLDFPSFKGVYGNFSATHLLDGYRVNLTASNSKSFQGLKSESQRYELSFDSNSQRIGDFPITFSYGAIASSARSIYDTKIAARDGVGVRARFLTLPQKVFGNAILNSSLSLTQLWGDSNRSGFGVLGSMNLHAPMGSGSSLQLRYDYAKDSLTSSLMGNHRLTGEYFLHRGLYEINLYAAKSLDIDSETLFADLSYSLSDRWRMGAAFTFDRFFDAHVRDRALRVGYRLGMREFGLTYSIDTGRIGFEFLNVPIR